MPALMSIQTNMAHVRAHRSITASRAELVNSADRLSSGKRIRSAGDDVAGSAIGNRLRAQIRGFQRAMANANEGVSILQMAESAYENITDNLIRMRTLAVQSASDGLQAKERLLLQNEFEELQDEIDRVSAAAEYNHTGLLTGSGGSLGDGTFTFQVGAFGSEHDRIRFNLRTINSGSSSLNVGKGILSVDTLVHSLSSIAVVDAALEQMADTRSRVGSKLNQLVNASTNLSQTIASAKAGESHISDVDMANESTRLATAQVLQQAGVSMLRSGNDLGSAALRLLG